MNYTKHFIKQVIFKNESDSCPDKSELKEAYRLLGKIELVEFIDKHEKECIKKTGHRLTESELSDVRKKFKASRKTVRRSTARTIKPVQKRSHNVRSN